MGNIAETIDNIVQKYELPKEYHAALWEAYEQGSEHGFWRARGYHSRVPQTVCKERRARMLKDAKNPRITEVSKSCHDWLVPMNIIPHKGRKE
jgi:hypothetical protein